MGNGATRLITLLLYLNDKKTDKAGGETAFPKAIVDDPNGLRIHAGMVSDF